METKEAPESYGNRKLGKLFYHCRFGGWKCISGTSGDGHTEDTPLTN